MGRGYYFCTTAQPKWLVIVSPRVSPGRGVFTPFGRDILVGVEVLPNRGQGLPPDEEPTTRREVVEMESPKEITLLFCDGLIDDLRLFDTARLPLDEAFASDSEPGGIDARLMGWLKSLNSLLVAPAPAG